MTKPGDFKNMDVTNPSESSDSITATIAATQVNAIAWMVPMNNLVVLTQSGSWLIVGGTPAQPQAVTPINCVLVPQTFVGCSPNVPPIVVNYDILYVQSKGSIVRDLAYNFWANIYTGTDMSILSNHLFFGHNIMRWCYAEQPFYQVWAVRDDGILLSFTYLRSRMSTPGRITTRLETVDPIRLSLWHRSQSSRYRVSTSTRSMSSCSGPSRA